MEGDKKLGEITSEAALRKARPITADEETLTTVVDFVDRWSRGEPGDRIFDELRVRIAEWHELFETRAVNMAVLGRPHVHAARTAFFRHVLALHDAGELREGASFPVEPGLSEDEIAVLFWAADDLGIDGMRTVIDLEDEDEEKDTEREPEA